MRGNGARGRSFKRGNPWCNGVEYTVRALATTQGIIDSFSGRRRRDGLGVDYHRDPACRPPHPAAHVPIFSRPPEATP